MATTPARLTLPNMLTLLARLHNELREAIQKAIIRLVVKILKILKTQEIHKIHEIISKIRKLRMVLKAAPDPNLAAEVLAQDAHRNSINQLNILKANPCAITKDWLKFKCLILEPSPVLKNMIQVISHILQVQAQSCLLQIKLETLKDTCTTTQGRAFRISMLSPNLLLLAHLQHFYHRVRHL